MSNLLQDFFYHKTIEHYTSVVGTLFNEIKISKSQSKKVKVALFCANAQKENTKVSFESRSSGFMVQAKSLPAIGFRFIGLQKDVSRLTNKRHKIKGAEDNGTVNTEYNRVPYIFSYEVAIKTKHVDEMFQIIEQISPVFNPSVNVVVKDNPYVGGKTPISISMSDIEFNDDTLGTFEEGREIISNFTLSVEGYLYMPPTTHKNIQTIELNFYDLVDVNNLEDSVVITGDNE